MLWGDTTLEKSDYSDYSDYISIVISLFDQASHETVELTTAVAFKTILKLFWHCANDNPTLLVSHLNRFG